jgi:hypothetical protein
MAEDSLYFRQGCKLVLEGITGEGLSRVEAEIKALFKER